MWGVQGSDPSSASTSLCSRDLGWGASRSRHLPPVKGPRDPSLSYRAAEQGQRWELPLRRLPHLPSPLSAGAGPTAQLGKLRPQQTPHTLTGQRTGRSSPPLLPLSFPPACLPRTPPRTHCRRRDASGCPARGRWCPRAGRSAWRRRGAASARRPPGAGSCVVSADCPGSPRRRAPVPAAATPGPATGGRASPRAPIAAGSASPRRVRGSAIAEAGAGRLCRASPRGPIGSPGGGACTAGGGPGETGWGRGPGADQWRGGGRPVGGASGGLSASGEGRRGDWAGPGCGAGPIRENSPASARVCLAGRGGQCVSVSHRLSLQGLRGCGCERGGPAETRRETETQTAPGRDAGKGCEESGR